MYSSRRRRRRTSGGTPRLRRPTRRRSRSRRGTRRRRRPDGRRRTVRSGSSRAHATRAEPASARHIRSKNVRDCRGALLRFKHVFDRTEVRTTAHERAVGGRDRSRTRQSTSPYLEVPMSTAAVSFPPSLARHPPAFTQSTGGPRRPSDPSRADRGGVAACLGSRLGVGVTLFGDPGGLDTRPTIPPRQAPVVSAAARRSGTSQNGSRQDEDPRMVISEIVDLNNWRRGRRRAGAVPAYDRQPLDVTGAIWEERAGPRAAAGSPFVDYRICVGRRSDVRGCRAAQGVRVTRVGVPGPWKNVSRPARSCRGRLWHSVRGVIQYCASRMIEVAPSRPSCRLICHSAADQISPSTCGSPSVGVEAQGGVGPPDAVRGGSGATRSAFQSMTQAPGVCRCLGVCLAHRHGEVVAETLADRLGHGIAVPTSGTWSSCTAWPYSCQVTSGSSASSTPSAPISILSHSGVERDVRAKCVGVDPL